MYYIQKDLFKLTFLRFYFLRKQIKSKEMTFCIHQNNDKHLFQQNIVELIKIMHEQTNIIFNRINDNLFQNIINKVKSTISQQGYGEGENFYITFFLLF